jgi:transposase
VRPYVKSNKNDFIDAEAIAEAVQRPSMRFVPVKTDEQLDLQTLHRVRERWVQRRVALVNQIRGFLLERGIPIRVGAEHLQKNLPAVLENAENGLSGRARTILLTLREEWAELEEKIEVMTNEIAQISRSNECCKRLMGVPGIGPIISTAFVAAVGNAAAFRKGRDVAAWLGLVPRQHSSGGKQKLLGISKRGNQYLRKLLVEGARAAFARLDRRQHSFGSWMNKLGEKKHSSVAVVALANKLARIAWAVLTTGQPYRPAM